MTSSRGNEWPYALVVYLLSAAAGGVVGVCLLQVLHQSGGFPLMFLIIAIGAVCGAGAGVAAESIANRKAMFARTAAYRAAHGSPNGGRHPVSMPRHAGFGDIYSTPASDIYPDPPSDVYPVPVVPVVPAAADLPDLPAPNYAVTPVEQPAPPRRVKSTAPDWWDAESSPEPKSRRDSAPRVSPAIGRYVQGGRVVQCTACAAFAVDVVRVEYGFNFRCQACGHSFFWEPTNDWPAWKVSFRSRSNP